MDSVNIKSSGAIYIAKDTIDNAKPTPIIKRTALEEGSGGRQQQLEEKAIQQKLVVGNEEVFDRADTFKQSTRYDDNPNFRIRQKLELYQSINSQEKRDDITQLLGVDIYA